MFSLSEIQSQLLSGEAVSWRGKKPMEIKLESAGARRLFEHLLTLDQADIETPDTPIFKPFISAWDAENDPAETAETTSKTPATGPWRLKTIRTQNFGGLNAWDGSPFILELVDENLILEGYNGSGKTSLASAVLWAMTGYRAQKQDAPVKETGKREPVYDGKGKQIADWPPITSYPTEVDKLGLTANTCVELTFEGSDGNQIKAKRSLTAPYGGEPVVTVDLDPELSKAAQLIEASLLMPARLPHVGFGKEKSGRLYDAIKMLTGLDQLASIGTGVSTLSRKSSKFLKYATDQNIKLEEHKFSSAVQRAQEHAEQASYQLPEQLELENDELEELLITQVTEITRKAEGAWEGVRSRVNPELDFQKKDDRKQLMDAIARARLLAKDAGSAIAIFKTWGVLKTSAEDDRFTDIARNLNALTDRLDRAIEWHHRQTVDRKLRLKAIAARFFIAPEDAEHIAHCPLCDSPLKEEDQKKLAEELTRLKGHEDEAERKLKDVCSEIVFDAQSCLPEALNSEKNQLAQQTPKPAFELALRAQFVTQEDIAPVMTGFVASVATHIETLMSELEDAREFTPPDRRPNDPDGVEGPRYEIALAKYAHYLAVWWAQHRESYAHGWKSFLGEADEDGSFPGNSWLGQLAAFETAFSQAEPLEKLAAELENAGIAAKSWSEIRTEQKKREDIVEAIAPLKMLSHLVDHVSGETLQTLSERMAQIRAAIHVDDRLIYSSTEVGKKAVNLKGALNEDIVIDATNVANTSWLRGVLWAFVFALREQSARALGVNAVPLMVFDDPQATFDLNNERRWAHEVIRRCKTDGDHIESIQLLVATHSRRFFNVLNSEQAPGARGELVGADFGGGCAKVIDGSILDRLRDQADASRKPDDMVKFIEKVRVHSEELLRVMLRGTAPGIEKDNLPGLLKRLETLHAEHVQPFHQRQFKDIVRVFDWNDPTIIIIQKPHHEDDGSIGDAEYKRVVKCWYERISRRLDFGFQIATEHAQHKGPPQIFPYVDNVVNLPSGKSNALAQVELKQTRVAVAATTDGRVFDGGVDVIEHDDKTEAPLKFHNHSAFVLTKPTLSPVAEPGDILIVRNYGEVNPKNLVVTACGDALLARRLNDAEQMPEVAILTGQGHNPYRLPDALPTLKEPLNPRKIIATLFAEETSLETERKDDEIRYIEDGALLSRLLHETVLLEVSGKSMEPIALDGQFLIVSKQPVEASELDGLSGHLVIATTETGTSFFKRFRRKGDLAVLETLNSTYASESEIVAIKPAAGVDQLTAVFRVHGVLFEKP